MALTTTQKTEAYQFFIVAFGAPTGVEYMNQLNDAYNAGMTTKQIVNVYATKPQFEALYPPFLTNQEFADKLIENVVGASATAAAKAEAKADVTSSLTAGWTKGDVVFQIFTNLAAKAPTDAKWGNTSLMLANKVAVAKYITETLLVNTTDLAKLGSYIASVTEVAATVDAAKLAAQGANGQTFTLTEGTAGTADVMRLVGDQDVRIDFTNPANQVKGLDLNGDGTIANNGVENNITGKAAGFEIVDAYARNPLNETSITQNFQGDIAFDGTGFGGDGVSTDGNIFLGGLGVDTAFGGIGNDFMTGGGIAATRVAEARAAWIAAGGTAANFVAPIDSLSGGRNADFFFVELSALDATDGNRVNIDGGTTADDSAAGTVQTAQDADWLLFEGSDDDEPVTINLRDDTTLDVGEATITQTGTIVSRSGQTVGTLRDIENFDASGNLYGFLDSMTDLQIGGRRVDDREVQNGTLNNGVGSSAQLIVSGSEVANIIIGGYDNDRIDGNGGNDLLMGGNLDNLINPNLLNIVNDGMDVIFGGAGNDNIVFEADGGIIEGDATQGVIAGGSDTLWLTNRALGTQTAADMTTDGVLRFDLDSQNIDQANGYGGADVGSKNLTPDDTQDQTNYKVGTDRVTVQDMENVIATGLGAVDYDTDGSNAGDIAHLSQVNLAAYEGNLTLRGTNGVNVLYASSGNDVIEGRTGGTYITNGDGTLNTTMVNGVAMPTGDARDKLSGGNGDDDFVFNLQAVGGDGVDVIHRQADANGDNIWDGYNAVTDTGTFMQDFGQVSAAVTANSKLTLTLTDAAHPTDLTGFPVNGISFSLDGVAYVVPLTAGIQSTYTAFNDGLNAALDAVPELAHLNSVLNADNTMTITDTAGKTFVASGYTFVGNVVPPAGTLTWDQAVGGPTVTQAQDRLIYRAYEDRLDNELVNDNATTGSTISLGVDAYAEDLVINFAADGTRIAEDQSYTINFANLTTQDKVTVAVNGVTYTLTVGVDLDGNSIAAEDGVGDTQVNIQSAFVVRMNAFINSFMDNDTAAGQVASVTNGTTTLTLTQAAYNTEETVFMTTPIVTVVNASAGELPVVTVTNNSGHEVLLFNYDGRNLDGTGVNLDGSNVKFWGDTETNQSLLQTANNLTGGTITGNNAVVVDGGANDLAGIANNTATNANLAVNFSVHGDDFILGGAAADIINAGTGDDRVQGSRGADVLDGGKNYYAVQVLGEAEARVITWNVWEAANPTSAQSLLADPTLAGKTLTNIALIGQTENGINVISGAFDDTLIYAQNDFVTGSTKFTVTLDDFTVAGGVVSLNNGGAGHVTVDLTGNGATADDSTSSFKNFENVRTVSGTGMAVAGVGGGQGNDTLDVSSLSTSTGGIEYDLTNRADAGVGSAVGAGKVSYSANAHASLTRPVEADFESLVMKVDGVESVIAGLGDDLLVIDETEAAKDNSFTASLGDDRIEYQNVFDAVSAVDRVAQPTITIQVNTASDQDMVMMTAGRVGTTVATDTLNSVEYITIAGNTATSSRENDVLDVTKMTGGAVVSYIDGTVKDLAGVTQVTVEGIAQIENVWADGNDTVIVASSAVMGTNVREDFTDATAAKDITFSTFLDFDEISATTGKRVAFLNQTSAMITDAVNNGEFTFNLSKTGTAADTDTVDYSMAVNSISAIVELDSAQANQYVMVDGDAAYAFHAGNRTADNDRVDVLTSVEKIVASQGESVLDLTSSTKGLEISFGAYAAANYQAAYDRDVYNVQISDLSSSVPLTRSYVEYREAGLIANSTAIPAVAPATWNRIEGSDNAEKVILNSAHSMDTDTFNLRGGANEVKYNELTKSITLALSVTDFVAATPTTTGLINGSVTFQDGTGAGVPGALIPGSGTHTISSYTANNGIAAGSLRIAASQDAEDNLTLSGLDEKIFLLSETGTVDNQITVKLGSGTAQNSVVLTGFELVTDAESNDVYDFGSIVNAIAGLNFIDNVANDHDTVKVDSSVLTALATPTGINLASINALATLAPAAFDFDVLDVTKMASVAVTSVTGTVGVTDEVVFGALTNIASATLFESVVLTQATLTENGSTFVLNTTANSLTAGAKTVTLSDNAATGNFLSFGGTVMEQLAAPNHLRAATDLNATGAVTVTMVGNEAVNITGGNGNDSITANGGADTLRGGQGNDTLNGGVTAAVGESQTITLGGGAAVLSGAETLTLTGNATTLIISASGGAGEIVTATATADADQIGALLLTQTTAFLETQLSYAAGSIASTAYNASSNVFTINFTSASGPQTNVAAAVSAGTMTAVTAESVANTAQQESLDTYVFEATAALNGVDTINNFNATDIVGDDLLDFRAFLGLAAATTDATATDFAATGKDLLAGESVGVVFNKATLAAGDIALATGANVAGKIGLLDNAKAVILVTADVDGAADATNNAYSVYYVQDTNTSVTAQTYTVTLVGTVNSTSELNAAALLSAANGGDVFV